MTLHCCPVNLQYVISVTSIENAITFAILYTCTLPFYTYEHQKTLFVECNHLYVIELLPLFCDVIIFQIYAM